MDPGGAPAIDEEREGFKVIMNVAVDSQPALGLVFYCQELLAS